MMLTALFWIGGAWAGERAGKWDGEDPDIRNERVIASAPARIAAVLSDLEQVRALWPEDCTGVWTPGRTSKGKGATASVRYDIAAMHRTLELEITAIAVNYIDHDHAGKKGFTTRYIFTALGGAEGGDTTKVEMRTPLYAPKWPLTGYYFRVVKPEWERCQTAVLEALALAVE